MTTESDIAVLKSQLAALIKDVEALKSDHKIDRDRERSFLIRGIIATGSAATAAVYALYSILTGRPGGFP